MLAWPQEKYNAEIMPKSSALSRQVLAAFGGGTINFDA